MLGQDSHLRIHFNLEGGSKHSIEHADFESCLIEYTHTDTGGIWKRKEKRQKERFKLITWGEEHASSKKDDANNKTCLLHNVNTS